MYIYNINYKFIMPSIYSSISDFIEHVKDEENVYITQKEYGISDCGRTGKMSLKWWKNKSTLIISYICLTSSSHAKNLLTTVISKILSNNQIIKCVILEGVYDEKLSEKLIEKGWYTDGNSNLRFE